MGLLSSIGISISSQISDLLASPEEKNTKFKNLHGFKDFDTYKSELQNFSLDMEDKSTSEIANLKNKAATKND